MNREVAAVSQAAVAADFDQAFDVHLHFTAQIALNLIVLRNVLANQVYIRFGQIFNPDFRVDLGPRQDRMCPRRADPINIGQSSFNPLIARKVDTFNSRHRSLSLSLFVLWVFANYIQDSGTLNDFAFRTAFTDGW